MNVPDDKLVSNERTKLLANALDRASTAALVVGVFGPVSGFLYGTVPPSAGLAVAIGSVIWLIGAAVLHYLAWRTLGRLK